MTMLTLLEGPLRRTSENTPQFLFLRWQEATSIGLRIVDRAITDKSYSDSIHH